MMLGADRSRLSKRHGAASVQAYRDAGIPADAMVNYLVRLGWSHGDQEVFSRAQLVELFDVKDVASSGAVFDTTKLEWLSQHYLKTMDGTRLAELAEPFVRAAGLTPPADRARFTGMLDTLRERAKTLVELVEQGRFYFEPPAAYDPKAAPKLLTSEGIRRLGLLIERLEAAAGVRPGEDRLGGDGDPPRPAPWAAGAVAGRGGRVPRRRDPRARGEPLSRLGAVAAGLPAARGRAVAGRLRPRAQGDRPDRRGSSERRRRPRRGPWWRDQRLPLPPARHLVQLALAAAHRQRLADG